MNKSEGVRKMKKKSFLLIFIVVCLIASNAFAAGCGKYYKTDCDGCNHEIRTFTCYRDTITTAYDSSCPYAPGTCSIMRRLKVHFMKCSRCGYGGGAYNIEEVSYYHTTCGR
jgi:hypothetical protein